MYQRTNSGYNIGLKIIANKINNVQSSYLLQQFWLSNLAYFIVQVIISNDDSTNTSINKNKKMSLLYILKLKVIVRINILCKYLEDAILNFFLNTQKDAESRILGGISFYIFGP